MSKTHGLRTWAAAWLYGMAGLCMTTPALSTPPPATTAAAAPTVKAAAQIPIADFIRPADFSRVRISPDGKYLSAIVPNPQNPHENVLAILDGKTAKVLHVIPSGKDALIAGYFWVGGNRLVGSSAFKQSGLDTPQATGELFAINADGTGQKELFGYRAGSDLSATRIKRNTKRYAEATPISEETAGDDQILIATNDFTSDRNGSVTDIEKLNVLTGHVRRIGVAPARNANLTADHAGQVRAAWTNDGFTEIRLWTRRNNDDSWILRNDSAKSGVTIRPIGFNRDNSRLYVAVSQGDGPDAVELMNPADGSLTMVYQGKFADPTVLLPTADGLDYYAIITADGKPALHYIDENSEEAQLSKSLASSFPGKLAYFSSFSRDGRHAVVRVDSDRVGTDYYLFDLTSHQAQFMVSAQPWLDPRVTRPMQPIALTARDGLPLHGFLTLPAGKAPFPMVVVIHGGPHGVSDQWGYDPEVQMLANRGYAVLQVNYRGSGGYGAKFIERGYRQWGLSMQDDVTDATLWAVKQGYADPKRLCLYGGSYGGYAALEGVVREPDLYECAIGYAGVYDLRVQLDRSDTQRFNAGVDYLKRVLGTDRDDLLRRSPLGGVARIKADLLLAHGKEDPRVPYKNFSEFTRALDANHVPYESLVEPDEGHGFFLPAHRLALYEKMLDFLDRNIGARGQTTP
ncbi:alpha/beta hydrolase family protein [Rhodanobacter lindaniclasticus]